MLSIELGEKDMYNRLKELVIISSLLLVSCGQVPHDIDPYFIPLIKRFALDAQMAGLTTGGFAEITQITFDSNMPPGREGTCAYNHPYIISPKIFSDFYKTIRINPDVKVPRANQDYAYLVFLHELGHCAYHLAHTSNPTDIMYPTLDEQSLQIAEANYFEQAAESENSWFSTDPP